ncbi:hypothetical protein ACLOJK_008690 [Asimina triloba]
MAKLVVVFLILLSFSMCLDARKLLGVEKNVHTLEGVSLIFNILPKGAITPPSGPSQRGHSTIVGERLFSVHPKTNDHRILESVPSPGVGH